MKKNRMDYIDTLKGIGILFVVYAHVNYTPMPLTLIYSFHMPLFFIVSGMLFDSSRYGSFGTFLNRRCRTLLVPYLLFSAVSMAYVLASANCFPARFDLDIADCRSYILQVFLAQGSKGVLNVPLWFVPCLFVVELLYYFLSKLEIALRIPVCMALAALGWLLESGLLVFDNTVLPWTLDSALFALSFYAAGNMAFPLVQKGVAAIRAHRHQPLVCLNVILVSVALWLPLALMNGKISLGSRVLGNGSLLFLTGIFGTAALLGLSLLVEKCPFLRFCGRNSFYIMATHYVVRKYTLPPLYDLLGIPLYDRKDSVQTIIPFLAVLLISLSVTAFLVWYKKKR